MSSTTILIIEDESVVALHLKKILQEAGYVVPPIAVSGEEAIQYADEFKPDLILMDIILEGNMDGIEAAKQIRQQRIVPIIYLTAFSNEELVERAKAAEPIGYVLKPFETHNLLTTIELALHQYLARSHAEENYRKLVEHALVGVYQTMIDGTILFANLELSRILNFDSPAQLKGANLFVSYKNPQDRVRMLEIMEREGEVRNFETDLLTRDGQARAVLLSAWHESNSISGIVRDITERKRMEEELRAARELFYETFHISPIAATLSTFPERRALDINPAFEKMLGYTRAELIGRILTDFDFWADPLERQRAFKLASQTGSLHNFEFQFKTKSGELGTALLNTEIIERGEARYMLTKLINITERKRMEETLRESEQRYSALFNKTSVPAVVAKLPEVVIVDANKAMEKLVGYTSQEMLGKTAEELGIIKPRTREELIEQFSSQSSLEFIDERITTKSGEERIVVVNTNALEINGQHYAMTTLQDITERKKALMHIQHLAERAETLSRITADLNKQNDLPNMLRTICVGANKYMNAVGTAMFLLDSKKGVFEKVASFTDDPQLQSFEILKFELTPEGLESLVSPEKPVRVLVDVGSQPGWSHLDAIIKERVTSLIIGGLVHERRLIGALFSVFSMDSPSVSIEDLSFYKILTEQAAVVIDRVDLFQHIQKGREQTQRLAAQLVEIQETERRHIARELHDQLGQSLTSVQFMLESAKKGLDPSKSIKIDDTSEAVRGLIEQVREMSLNLRPSMLDDMGLISTLEWHFGRYTKQTGVRVNYRFDPLPARLPAEIETAGYRIIQEALTNVVRHAQVEEVFVGIAFQEESLWIEIVDKGKGFGNSKVADQMTIGLGGMSERALMVGGYLMIESSVHQGTKVVAVLPLTGERLERRRHENYRSFGR